MRRFLGLIIILESAFNALAQAPSQQEQQYLFTVLPLIDQGDLARAEAQLTAGIGQYPQSAILQNALGIVYRKENKFEQAVAAFRKALELVPAFTAAQLQLASTLQQRGNNSEAARLFRAAAEGTTNFDALMAAGLGLADSEDYLGAARAFEKALAIRPGAEAVIYNLALAQYKSGDLTTALDSLKSIPTADDRPDNRYLRGKILESSGKADAITDLMAACRLAPGNETYCADAALGAIRLGKFPETVDLLQPAVEKSPGAASLWSLLGLAQFRLGRYRDAIRSYDSALAKDSGLEAAREGIGFLYYITGELEKARGVLEQGLKNSTADFYLAYLEALVLYRTSPDLRSSALVAANRALAANAAFAPSYFLRGKIRMDQNDLDAALTDFKRAVELDPKYPLPYYKMSQVYSRRGLSREAEAARRKFSQLGSLREEEVLAKQTQNILMPAAH